MSKFVIFDWAGNDKTPYYGEFETFEDAWGRLYQEFDHLWSEDDETALNEQMEEFYVLEKVGDE